MALEMENVGLTVRIRGKERALLRQTSLALAAGEIIGLMGPSGSGKTTLLRLLAGLDRRSGGTIRLDGDVVEGGDLPRYRCRVSLVPQCFQPPAGTPSSFLSRVRDFASRDRAWPDRLQLEAEIGSLGLNAQCLDQTWEELSGGEQRRMLIALTLALAPDYLLLDEPFSGLDSRAQGLLVPRLKRAAEEGAGIILVSHQELLLARLAGRVVVLIDGSVEGDGAVLEILPGACSAVGRKAAP